MDKPIRILGIAPYDGIKVLMERVARSCPNVELTTCVGDLQQGAEAARSNFHGNYDLIVSRGGTAQMLQKLLPIPVIEIEISLYDILCAIKLSQPLDGRTAIVGFANITASARLLQETLGHNIDIFTIQETDEVEFTLRRLQAEGYQVVLCDMIANTTAKRLGLNAFLITSGVESVRAAFDRAVRFCGDTARLREENQFLREIIRGQVAQTIVLDEAGELYFSSQPDPDPNLLNLLRHSTEAVASDGGWSAIRGMAGTLYSLSARRLRAGALEYVVFYISASRSPLPANRSGIRFFTRKESEDAFYNSIFSVSGVVSELQEDIDRLDRSPLPLMLSGEDGTGKGPVVSVLYTTGPLQNHALVTVDCGQTDEKSWGFLLNHHDSPLSDADNTIYFQNIDQLAPERRGELLSALQDMNVCRRNRVVFSCVCRQDETLTPAGAAFSDALCCLSLYLPPLRARPERIPPLVNLYLSQLNVDMERQILGVEPEALKLLRHYSWPHNYTQFKRVVTELAVTAAEPIITAPDVRRVLSKEKNAVTSSPMAEDGSAPLDLDRPLSEIERDVARRVLEEAGGNQTKAARRLEISRTTLWRMLREEA